MVKDSKTVVFGNYDFLRKNQNFEWVTHISIKDTVYTQKKNQVKIH